jgi:hypothetical protein
LLARPSAPLRAQAERLDFDDAVNTLERRLSKSLREWQTYAGEIGIITASRSRRQTVAIAQSHIGSANHAYDDAHPALAVRATEETTGTIWRTPHGVGRSRW